MIGIGMMSGRLLAQTLSLTSASPSYDVGNTTYSITGLTVADNVNGVITGAGGTLNYSGGAPFVLGSTTNGARQNLDMSGLSNFIFDNATQSFTVSGRYSGSFNVNDTIATLTLAGSSVITASEFDVGTVPNGAAIATHNVGIVNFGANTTINADAINVGAGAKATGTLTLAAGGTLILRGADGSSPVANWNIGIDGVSSLASTTGSVNLGAGSINALVTNLLVGHAGTSGSQVTSGSLTLGTGTLNATTIFIAQTPTVSNSNVAGTLTIGDATVTTQTLILGDHPASGGTDTAVVNLNGGGTLLAQTIQSGAGASTRTFNWSNGTIGNYASGQPMTVSVDSLSLSTTNPHVFDIEGADATATVSSVLSGAGGFTKIGAGLLALTGSNTYTGGTVVSDGLINFQSLSNLGAGNITLNGGGLQWATGNTVDVSARLNPLGANGATFDTNGNNVTLAGNLSGAGGSLIKDGAGVLVLTGTNTYDGGTQINAGTLQLGKGGVSGSIVGNVTDNSQLTVVHSDTLILPGVISGSGSFAQNGTGTTIFTADNTYTGSTLIVSGSLQLGDGGTSGSIAGDVLDGALPGDASLVIDRSDAVTLPGNISGFGALNQIGTGTTILTGANTYTGGTTIVAGTLQLGNGGVTGSIVGDITDNGTLAFNRADSVVYSNLINGSGGLTQLGPGTLQLDGDQTYTGDTDVLAGTLAIDGSIQSSTTTVAPGATLSGFGTIDGDVINQGTVWPGRAVAGDTDYGALTIHGNYVGQNGVLALNTFLGADNSPTDQLVIDGGTASGNTTIAIHNTASSVGETTGDGILVVSTIHGGTTTPDAFALDSELRVSALDYRLFRGGLDGQNADNWYLRNEFTVPPEPPQPPEPPPPEPPPPEPPLPPNPPDPVLPPGVYPIIGPEVATYGAVQPVARDLGLLTLGTMDQRIGDSALMVSGSADSDHGPSVWARTFATHIDDSYDAFAAPNTKGDLSGFQIGADIWQGELIPGQIDRWGGYFAYGHADVDVRGLVTNAEATGYAMQSTGSLTLNARSAGVYWTHYGPNDWYLDAVMQASTYDGSAGTVNARLNTHGDGFMGSLEFGYPFSLPQLGSGFVLEPQTQVIWQQVSFGPDNDGFGEVALGETNGTSARLGARGKWQWNTPEGVVWEPYVSANFWRDWGARASTVFSGADSAALLQQASRFEFDGGVTARLAKRLAVYGALGYQLALGDTTNAQRRGFNGNLGLRYTW